MTSPITTHILDTSLGRPASGVGVTLEMKDSQGNWKHTAQSTTNEDGRVMSLGITQIRRGSYRLIFDTETYFAKRKVSSFYRRVTVEFEIDDENSHYHVPLLLTPFGYTTYRGS